MMRSQASVKFLTNSSISADFMTQIMFILTTLSLVFLLLFTVANGNAIPILSLKKHHISVFMPHLSVHYKGENTVILL